MYCTKCGKPNSDSANYCAGCGARLGIATKSNPASLGTQTPTATNFSYTKTAQDPWHELVFPLERLYFQLSAAISIVIYILFVFRLPVLVLLMLLVFIYEFILRGILVGHIRGNGIRVSEQQFPEVYSIAKNLAQQMRIELPPIYVLEGGGTLNAFASRFANRYLVVILSDVFEAAYEQGESELGFIIAHELAHIKRNHLAPWRAWLLGPAQLLIPFLGLAYSRACEYTCDRMATYLVPQGACSGLLILAAGKRLYRRVNDLQYQMQLAREGGFFVWLSEILSTHPHLPNRITQVREMQERIGLGYRIRQRS
jgi:Zn-dependent protease with chaperone function